MRLNDEDGVEPADAELVALGILRVPVRSPTLPPATRTNVYVVRGLTALWVVDPGTPDELELERLDDHLATAESALGVGFGGVILTHHHRDHVSGVEWLIQRRDAGRVVCTGATAALADLGAAARAVAAFEGDGSCDGLELVFTPGHAPGHVAVWTGEGHSALASRVLLAGDLVAGIGTVLVNPPRGDMRAYCASLLRAAALDPARLFPAHGPGTADGAGRLRATLAHRLAREARVVAATPDAWAEVRAITADAYADVPNAFLPIAERSALAHLEKLVADGLVERAAELFRRAARD